MALHLDLSPQYHGSAEVFLLFVCVEILRTGFSEKRRESHSGTEEQGRGLQFCCHLFYRRDGMLLQRQFLMGRHWFSCNRACSRARLGHRIVVPWTQGVRWCCGECQCSSPFLFPWRIGCTLLQGRSHFLEREKHDGHGWSSCSMRKGWRMGDSVWKKMALQVLTAAPGTTRREVVKKREPKTRSISWTKPERFRWCTWRRIQGGRGVGCPQRLCQLCSGEFQPQGSTAMISLIWPWCWAAPGILSPSRLSCSVTMSFQAQSWASEKLLWSLC